VTRPVGVADILDEMWALWLGAIKGIFRVVALIFAFFVFRLERLAAAFLYFVERWEPSRPAIFSLRETR
jgi:hypothetical protein